MRGDGVRSPENEFGERVHRYHHNEYDGDQPNRNDPEDSHSSAHQWRPLNYLREGTNNLFGVESRRLSVVWQS